MLGLGFVSHLISISFSDSRTPASVKDWYLILSRASEALLMSSLRKISLLE